MRFKGESRREKEIPEKRAQVQSGACESRLEVRLREGHDARSQDVEDAGDDRRIHAGVPGDPRGNKAWESMNRPG